MKQAMTFLVTLTVCFCTGLFSYAQSVKGNKNVVTQERKVEPFTALDVQGMGDIVIKQGTTELVKVTTDENIQPYIETLSTNGVLVVRTKFPEGKNHAQLRSSGMSIEITVKNIQQITLDALGDVKIPAALNADALICRISRVGGLDLNLACKKLTLKVDASGHIHLRGSADDADININRAGNLRAFEFAAKKLTANLNAIGDAELNAEEELSIDASAIGNLTYKGNAAVKKLETSAAGSVRKM